MMVTSRYRSDARRTQQVQATEVRTVDVTIWLTIRC